MKSAPFVAAIVFAIIAAGLMLAAVYHGAWLWVGIAGLALAALIVVARVLAMGMLLAGKA
jgi:hypothetical protein